MFTLRLIWIQTVLEFLKNQADFGDVHRLKSSYKSQVSWRRNVWWPNQSCLYDVGRAGVIMCQRDDSNAWSHDRVWVSVGSRPVISGQIWARKCSGRSSQAGAKCRSKVMLKALDSAFLHWFWPALSNHLSERSCFIWSLYTSWTLHASGRFSYFTHSRFVRVISCILLLYRRKHFFRNLHVLFFWFSELQMRSVKLTSINSTYVFYFTKSYVWTLVRIVSMSRF